MDQQAVLFLEHEARAMLSRLGSIKPFALSQMMVSAANVSPEALAAIERHLERGRARLRWQIERFIRSLAGGPLDDGSPPATPAGGQQRFALLRVAFNVTLTQFDLFSDALAQRGDLVSGVWLSGLDALASDAMDLPAVHEAPPALCYLDRGIGAAIRRARTRLPGGGENPVALIRVPRERMVSSSIASSLVHEAGHQAAASLGLVNPLRVELNARARGSEAAIWSYWGRCISEILADFWSIARLGVASTLGLMNTLSLPAPFVHRVSLDDPHPVPWIRVLLSCALGSRMFPDPQWEGLARLWRQLYPIDAVTRRQRRLLLQLSEGIGELTSLLVDHRPRGLGGRGLQSAVASSTPSPRWLRERFSYWRVRPTAMLAERPCRACAIIGQARADGRLSPRAESDLMARLFTHWALRRSASCDGRTLRNPSRLAAGAALTLGGQDG